MKKLITTFSLCLLMACSSNLYAQTTYKSDAGFFTPVVKSLYLRSGSIEDTQLIGPAVGYRFNKTYDIAVHAEFLSSEFKFNNRANPKTTLLNLGVILGRTQNLSQNLLWRSKISLYKSIISNTEGYENIPEPSLASGLFSSSLYRSISLSGSVSLLPNLGAFLGYGDYRPAYSSANLRQGFDGFVVGPRLGFDVSFKLSDSFYLVASPEVRIPLNNDNRYSENTLLFNIQLNF